MKSSKTSGQKNPLERNPFEFLADGFKATVGKDLAKDSVDDFFEQIMGFPKEKRNKSGDLTEGEEFDLSSFQKDNVDSQITPEQSKHIEPAIDYFREIAHAEQRISSERSKELEYKVKQITVELERIAQSSKIVEAQFKEVVVEQRIQKVGKYHENFFEWVLVRIQEARRNIEDSGAWLAAFKSKKTKQGYWSQAKSKGTSFTQSNERSVATQSG